VIKQAACPNIADESPLIGGDGAVEAHFSGEARRGMEHPAGHEDRGDADSGQHLRGRYGERTERLPTVREQRQQRTVEIGGHDQGWDHDRGSVHQKSRRRRKAIGLKVRHGHGDRLSG
jgi:hypothetical protein